MTAAVALGEVVEQYLTTLPADLAAVVRSDMERVPPLSPAQRDHIASAFAGGGA